MVRIKFVYTVWGTTALFYNQKVVRGFPQSSGFFRLFNQQKTNPPKTTITFGLRTIHFEHFVKKIVNSYEVRRYWVCLIRKVPLGSELKICEIFLGYSLRRTPLPTSFFSGYFTSQSLATFYQWHDPCIFTNVILVVSGMQNLSISCALVCLIILGCSALVGAFGVLKHQISAVLVTGVMYLLAGMSSLYFCILNDLTYFCGTQM